MKINSLPTNTHIAFVHLHAAHLQSMIDLYVHKIGFKIIGHDSYTIKLSVAETHSPQIILTELPEAKIKPANTIGLYHTAIRLPDRSSLAQLLKRLIALGQRFYGFADHGVSEAIYLADPEGNGVELYTDRPKTEWPYSNGQLVMLTDPLDVNELLTNANVESWSGLPQGTDIGHIHLHVSDLGKARLFYHELLGMDITQSSYPGALFMSAGGYHHHIGTNIWAGRNQPPDQAAGLREFGIAIPDTDYFLSLKNKFEMEKRLTEIVSANEFVASDFDNIRVKIIQSKN